MQVTSPIREGFIRSTSVFPPTPTSVFSKKTYVPPHLRSVQSDTPSTSTDLQLSGDTYAALPSRRSSPGGISFRCPHPLQPCLNAAAAPKTYVPPHLRFVQSDPQPSLLDSPSAAARDAPPSPSSSSVGGLSLRRSEPPKKHLHFANPAAFSVAPGAPSDTTFTIYREVSGDIHHLPTAEGDFHRLDAAASTNSEEPVEATTKILDSIDRKLDRILTSLTRLCDEGIPNCALPTPPASFSLPPPLSVPAFVAGDIEGGTDMNDNVLILEESPSIMPDDSSKPSLDGLIHASKPVGSAISAASPGPSSTCYDTVTESFLTFQNFPFQFVQVFLRMIILPLFIGVTYHFLCIPQFLDPQFIPPDLPTWCIYYLCFILPGGGGGFTSAIMLASFDDTRSTLMNGQFYCYDCMIYHSCIYALS